MYVTRPLSTYYKSPEAAFEPPPEGPNSGILVVEDEEAEAQRRTFFGLFKTSKLSSLPFPQNKMIKVKYTRQHGQGQSTYYRDDCFFIPVLGQPLSSNSYYVVKAQGRDKGKICSCSKEEDMTTCCFCLSVNDVEPALFDHRDIYQQVQISPRNTMWQKGYFHAKAVALNGFPRRFLRRKGWEAYTKTPKNYHLNEALGIDINLRNQLPSLEFPISSKCSPSTVVGKWYCPYIFIKENMLVKDQMTTSMFYEMTLEQLWENIYYAAKSDAKTKGNAVHVSVDVVKEIPLLNGKEVTSEDVKEVDGVIWFKSVKANGEGLGLSMPVWERMKWEEARGGFGGKSGIEKVEYYEEGNKEWRIFGSFVLVERFVLRRMDGSIALTYDFKHTNKVRTKWE